MSRLQIQIGAPYTSFKGHFMKKVIISLIGLLAIFAFSSCQKDGPAENGTIPTGVNIAESVLNLVVHETKAIDFTTTPSNANTSELVWTSNDETIATVVEGMVTGVRDGSTKVVVALYDHKAKAASATPLASITVNVTKKAVTTVTISETEATIINGKTLALTAKASPADASFLSITWSSSDESVATVKDGTVTAKKAGNCVITAKGDGDVKATCNITVIDADDFDINTDASAGSTTIVGGDQADIAATDDNFLSYDSATQTVSWTENTTGKVREASLELASGSKIKVSQASVTASSLKGGYNFTSKIFSKDAAKSGITAGNKATISVEFTSPLKGETLKDENGRLITNTIGIKGLLGDIIVDATVVAGEDGNKVGVFMDGRTAQKCANGKDGFDYIAVLPGLGQGFISANYNFLPSPITSDLNYCWIWFDMSEDGTTLRYATDNKQKLTNNDVEYYVIAISLVPCKTETIEASQLDDAWWVVYQANPDNNVKDGLSFTKK